MAKVNNMSYYYTTGVGERENWYLHHRLKWTIIIKSKSWYTKNELNIMRWLDSEGILVHNTIKNRIFLYSEEQLQYFTLRWS